MGQPLLLSRKLYKIARRVQSVAIVTSNSVVKVLYMYLVAQCFLNEGENASSLNIKLNIGQM